jgi:rSAM/selenodomain-associated transferase 1
MAATVGVMARAPIAGRCKTRLASVLGATAAASVYRAMLLDTLDGNAFAGTARLVVMAAPEDHGAAVLGEMVPAPWEIIPQHGEGLGARLAHAFRTLGAGGEVVALVDSDSPTAPWAEAAAAISRFEGRRRALMGPCEDGGYYLIALRELELGILDGIAWSTPRVQEQTRARCASLGLALDELSPGYDVDDSGALARLRAQLRADPSPAPRTAAVLEAIQ